MNELYAAYMPTTPQEIVRLKQLATDAVSDLSGMIFTRRVPRKRGSTKVEVAEYSGEAGVG